MEPQPGISEVTFNPNPSTGEPNQGLPAPIPTEPQPLPNASDIKANWQNWSGFNPYQGFADPTVQNVIAGVVAALLGQSTPAYKTIQHYQYHKQLGQNVKCAPVLFGVADFTSADFTYPTALQIQDLGAPWWVLGNKQPSAPNTGNQPWA